MWLSSAFGTRRTKPLQCLGIWSHCNDSSYGSYRMSSAPSTALPRPFVATATTIPGSSPTTIRELKATRPQKAAVSRKVAPSSPCRNGSGRMFGSAQLIISAGAVPMVDTSVCCQDSRKEQRAPILHDEREKPRHLSMILSSRATSFGRREHSPLSPLSFHSPTHRAEAPRARRPQRLQFGLDP